MSVICPVGPALLLSRPEKKHALQMKRKQQEMDKALEKHRKHLQKPEIQAELEKAAKLKQHKTEHSVILSNHIPLDTFISKRKPLPKPHTNLFANVKCHEAESNLKKIGLTLESTGSGSSHHAVRTLPQPGHIHGYRVGLIAKHNGTTIPDGTHHAMLHDLNEGFVRLLNHADDTVSVLPLETQNKFRDFVAQNLSDAGAKSREEILPDDLLSTDDHGKIKALRAIVEKANPDTVLSVWKEVGL